ncbi:hypothetical protein [Bartonella sp. AU18XJBT]|uniref:hypothetical protein n=1 Tax=Bartonella sp. AU18XJBT TaxID=3019089 RepID=UPI002360723B|nr:hypothetical protein [Bartonella sp. AU18XJBT]
MCFLHLYCKKENFLPLTTWIFLSSLGVLLTSNLGTRAYLIKQSHTNNIIKTNRFDLQNKYDQLNTTTTENKKLVTPHAESIFMRTFQRILTLDFFLIKIPAVDTRFCNIKMQYFSNKRAPPNKYS